MNYKNLILKIGVLIIGMMLFSCNQENKYEQVTDDELNQEQITNDKTNPEISLADFKQYLSDHPRENTLEEVVGFNGKRVVDFYKEWLEEFENRANVLNGSSNACGNPPSGCVVTNVVDEIRFIGSCEITCSYDVYDCGFGNVGIYNFTFEPTGNFCSWFDILITNNYDDQDYDQYVDNNNFIAALLLSQIEDDLLPTINTPNNTVVFFTYFPNICVATCSLGGAQDICGEDCCIRFSVAQFGQRSVDVFPFGLCEGTNFDCTNSVVSCDSRNCRNLQVYR